MVTGLDAHTDFVEGAVLLIDKPLDWSSFDVVKKIRNAICRKFGINKIKVGHAGTLDPLATGLIIVCTGKATKQMEFFQEMEKEYMATLNFGESTPSFDLETNYDHHYPAGHINMELINSALVTFKGESLQIPPAFSAKRLSGKRAYNYARQGKEPKMRPQTIHIYEIEALKFENPELVFRIRCSKGTYIRSLARDIGKKLETGAHLTALRRTLIGEYSVDAALSPEKFTETLSKM